jgi:hypothetical protein
MIFRNAKGDVYRNAKQQSMTCEEQVRRWVAGESVHNSTTNECCPDFSCCRPGLLANLEEREKFQNAGEWDRNQMLVGFLKALLENATSTKVRMG